MQRRSTQIIFTTAKLARLIAAFAVLGFTAAVNAEDVVLSWSDNSDNEDGFNIERAIGDGAFQDLAQVGSDVETYTDSTAQAGVDYKYRVNAFNAFGESGYTNIASHYINVAPVISAINDVTVEENEATNPISFSVSDFESASGELSVAVASSNSGLLDQTGVLVQGTDGSKTLTLTPKQNISGQSTVTVTVSDGVYSSSASFQFSVNSYVFPTLQLALDSISSQPRAGEPFLVQATASDTSDISAVSYWIGGELVETVAASPYEASLSISEAGSYTIAAVASITGREQTVTVEQQVLVGAAPADANVVDNLATLSVDESSDVGSASYDLASDTFTLEDQNGEISGRSDSHRYYYILAQGDVSIEAQVAALDSASGSTLAGLMVRSALYGKSPQASILLDGNAALSVRTRSSRAADTEVRAFGASGSAAPWLRIEKTSTSVRYFKKASEGDAWTLVASDSLQLGEDVFLGFALAGGSAQGIVSADFTRADFNGVILTMGADAAKPSIPSGLLISSLSK